MRKVRRGTTAIVEEAPLEVFHHGDEFNECHRFASSKQCVPMCHDVSWSMTLFRDVPSHVLTLRGDVQRCSKTHKDVLKVCKDVPKVCKDVLKMCLGVRRCAEGVQRCA